MFPLVCISEFLGYEIQTIQIYHKGTLSIHDITHRKIIKLLNMKKLKFIILATWIILIASSCGSTVSKKTDPADENIENPAINVKTMILKEQSISSNLEFSAGLLPYEEIHFAPASPGRIEKIYVEVDSRVKKGDIIAEMDHTQLNQAMEQLKNAESSFQRMDTLFKLGSISEQQYEGVKTQYELARTSVEFLKKNTRLLSPIDAIVTGKYFEGRELYSGVPNTAAGKAAIVTLMQINPLKAVIHVSEKYYPELRKGLPSVIYVDTYPDMEFQGEILRVFPYISPETRTFQVEIKINNPSEILRPGMFTRVNLQLGEKHALLVPSGAVLRQEGTNRRHVFVAAENKAKKVNVIIAERYDDQVHIISDDIKEGDEIIIAGQEKLMDNSKISIVR